MTGKQKKWLIRIGVAAALFLVLLVGDRAGLFLWMSGGRTGFTGELPILLFSIAAYLAAGYDVLIKAGKNIVRGKVFDENFLMVLATFGAFGIGEYKEAVAVMIFYQIGEWFQSLAVGKSRRSISELMSIAPEYVNIEENGTLVRTDPEDVEVGTVFTVKPGERVALDGVVVGGRSFLDTSSLTGESAPREIREGEEIVSGSVNLSGLLSIRATKRYEDSTVSRVLELVENASDRKAPVENFITRFARYYTPVVTVAAVLLALVMPFLTDRNFAEWIRRACSFLVISCPCALVISVPLGFFGGIGAASKIGVLVKGSNFLEALSKVKTVAFDKTGTLTKGHFSVTEIHHREGVEENEVILKAAAVERYSTHPAAGAIQAAAAMIDQASAPADSVQFERIEEISGKGVIAFRTGDNGGKQTGKAAYIVGSGALLREYGVDFEPVSTAGTAVYVAENGRFLGSIVISDEAKEGAKETILALKKAGVRRTVMLSGDRKEAAEYMAASLGVDEVRAELMPEDKVKAVEGLIRTSGKGLTAFVGDGINDAPVLVRADVGLAMGSLGSDAAIEAADIVLMDDRLEKIVQTVHISRKTLRIVHENIGFALGVKFVVLCLGAIGLASMWLAMFADVGVAVLAILNSMRALKVPKKTEGKKNP